MVATALGRVLFHAVAATRWGVRSNVAMIRNVDRCEALFIGACFPNAATLVEEALESGTIVFLQDGIDDLASELPAHLRGEVASFSPGDALLGLLEDREVTPQGFGGSGGFGAKPQECPRPPEPARAVVITDDISLNAEAIRAGMRTIALIGEAWSSEDIAAADAMVDVVLDACEAAELSLGDLCTPGSFWLNPPLPREPEEEAVVACRQAPTLATGTLGWRWEDAPPARRERPAQVAAHTEPAVWSDQDREEAQEDPILLVDAFDPDRLLSDT